MLKSCFNPKVLVGLAAMGAGVAVLSPGLLQAALPLLILAACPLSMLLMGRMGMAHGSSVPAAAGVYTCPMHPEVRSDKPGRCPKCGMELVGATSKMESSPAVRPSVEVLQARLQAMNEQQAALAHQLEELQKTEAAPALSVLDEAERIAQAAAERH